MNQILVTEKIYVTQRVRRKKFFYKVVFVVSILITLLLLAYYFFTEYDKVKGEQISKEILKSLSFKNEAPESANDTLVVALNDKVEEIAKEEKVKEKKLNNVYTTENGTEYVVDSILNIPSLGINYPVLSETSDELLKISLNKFWGCEPNAVGNYCIVGHNYDGKDIFFGKLNKIKNGDIVELEDCYGEKIQYKVYNTFIVKPTDVACTSQLTNGKREITLITCSDGGRTRFIVKCREIE